MPTDNIIEEHEFHRGTGVEWEDLEDEERDIEKPWDPKLIRVDPKNFSLRNILDMIDDGDLELAPDFQRNKVWTLTQKSRLIESIFLRIPLPAFYFSEDDEGMLQVIDGLQRLSTIHDFVRGKSFELDNLEYLKNEVEGKDFKDIDGSLWSRRIYNTQIIANIVDPQTPDNVKFDIFKRINTAGSPLKAQEIRHCMSGSRSRAFLKSLADSELFNRATANKLRDHIRMVDREIILRFCAFRLKDIDDYMKAGTMDDFLTQITHKMDKSLTNSKLQQLKRDFECAMENAYKLFGPHAFRKWPKGDERLNPINRALFETWGVRLSYYEWDQLRPYKESIVEAAREMMRDDDDFISSVSVSTSSFRMVKTRFEKVAKLFDLCG